MECGRCGRQVDPEKAAPERCFCPQPMLLVEAEEGESGLELDLQSPQPAPAPLPVAAGQWVHPAADAQASAPPASQALELSGSLAPLTSRALRFLLSFAVVQEAVSAFLSVVGLVMEWIRAHPANDPMPAGSRITTWLLCSGLLALWTQQKLRARELAGGRPARGELRRLLLTAVAPATGVRAFRGFFPGPGRALAAYCLQGAALVSAMGWVAASRWLHPHGNGSLLAQLGVASLVGAALLATRQVVLEVEVLGCPPPAEAGAPLELAPEPWEPASGPQAAEAPRPATPSAEFAQAPAPAPAPAPALQAPDASHPPPAACISCGAELHSRRCPECGAAAVAGSYRIERVLGSSAERRTYLARDPAGQRLTLKEISLSTAANAATLEAFQREAVLLKRLRHSRIPPLLDTFAEGDGPARRFYLAHQYVAGVSLEEEVDGRLYQEAEVVAALAEVLKTLCYLQSLAPPVFHRDIKPSNLIRRGDGTLVLIDFGSARHQDLAPRAATVNGSFGFMPPEQLAGQVNATSDLYALGATALQMLTHKNPWEFMDGSQLKLPPLTVSRGLQRLLQRLLAARPQARFPGAAEALAAVVELDSLR